jgi:hypothetical protein
MNTIKIIGDTAFISNDRCGWTLTRNQARASLSGAGGVAADYKPHPKYEAYMTTLRKFAYGE